MKKLLYLFSTSLLVLTSCSSDDSSSSDATATSILPKTVKVSNPSYPSKNYSSMVYNGNKIVSITREDGDRTDYTYDGNLIVKITGYDTENGKDEKSFEISYTYVNNKLATDSYEEIFTTEFPTGDYKGRSVYTHNSDGTVKKESWSTKGGVETKDDYVTVSTFVNGNLVKRVSTYETFGSSNSYTNLYEYDTKNSPFKNIMGFSSLLLVDEYETCSVNNIVKETSSYGSQPSTVYEIEYVYDANGYPTKQTKHNAEGTTIDEVTKYTY